ncbi:TFIID-31kDa-domain-containing protein [Plenodomus tracheiphilus IPT5]|uniref:TFIID-31kDa-domain-containing protein n=1 Tax=Plenodomus tracheiphilus IPT5 TaxID=1408161 RepID=A0A6A7BGL0_9PLEO|nr:TFIID-31kDa-domain-containing protein [Plenodomus tracheiphilus IPT5]
MASPAAEQMQNGITTPPATTTAPHPSPPSQSTQPTTQPSASQLTNGTSAAPPITNMNAPFPPTSLLDPGISKRPRDARLVHLILANMGVTAYTERVPLQLLDFAYRYTSSILTDAISYEPPTSLSTSKKRGADKQAEEDSGGVGLNALRTAVGARAASQFSAQLGKEFMSEVASERNRIALPRVEREYGIRLPPERYCFTGVGWGVRGAWEEVEEEGSEEDEDEEMDGGAGDAVGFGGPVGGEGVNGTGAEEDTAMGGMEEEEIDEDEFEEAMGVGGKGGAA